ncbi:alpha/beta hydrolase [Actinomadura barringtoniae]|uniref:Alpha/beta hydrolase n=1 Tax=Actinomadura barringtoniae TaxID=1427535 RepID=A0A939P5M1_9ACTN|nr:alpha/beta hydrolase [Actinomadura barringtoniae]MBO2445722.1 alpha/beta hydrolase [Actinomadura barringtoniae]
MSPTDLIPVRAVKAVVGAAYGLPKPVKRLIAGRPVRRDGQTLALEAQLLLTLSQVENTELGGGGVDEARVRLERAQKLIDPKVPGVQARELSAGGVRSRLYTPKGLAEGSPLLVFYHGGGFAVGSLNSHDNVCKQLAVSAKVRVLSVDYRLAPEHPFPAGVEDALAAYEYAVENAEALGADPDAIAVGGDSAGGNLAAVVSLFTERRKPAFALLFYPTTDLTSRRRSRELFGEGFYLTDKAMTWFSDHYCPEELRKDPKVSPLLADDLSDFPATYLVTAGFDPLRDEGEEFARRLEEAGVKVALRRQDDLIHGFANMFGLGGRFAEALAEAAGALRMALTLR